MNNGPEPKTTMMPSIPSTPHGLPVRIVRFAGLLIFINLIVQHGFPISKELNWWLNGVDLLLAAWFVGDLVLALFLRPRWRNVLVARRVEYVLLSVFLVLILSRWILPPATTLGVVTFLHLQSPGALTMSLVKLFLLACLCIQLLRATQRLFGRGVRPELVLAGSFATLIVVGTLLLLLPNSSADPERPIGIVDAFFTATSAACVTGLVVRDTGTEFSLFGQTVILAAFQVGGLGIVTFVAFLSVFSRRTLPVQQMVAFRQIIHAPAVSDMKRQIGGILLLTGVIELLGAAAIFYFLPRDGDPFTQIRWSIFHSVSAFSSAGFTLQSDSLESIRSNAGLNITFISLMVLGGLGFLVIPELLGYRFTRAPFFRSIPFFRRLHAGHVPGRLTIQTRLAVTLTIVLLIGGFLGFLALEFKYILLDRPWSERLLIAAFQSVTPRTIGLTTVPVHELRDATLVFLIMLMVIGANPVSTGGGIKTVSFGILLLALRAMVAQRERVEAFGRTIPGKTLFAALSVFVIYVITASVGVFLLALFDPEMRLQDQVFEVISALSTVGLSTGITADLSVPSKLVLCVAMFVGRIGPISLVLSVFQSRRRLAYEFPEEEVVVG